MHVQFTAVLQPYLRQPRLKILRHNDCATSLQATKVIDRVQVPDLMASGKEDVSLADIEAVLPFQLDRFQAQAIDILLQGSSVVVSAPTGAGKTIIAEAATLAVLARCWDSHGTAGDSCCTALLDIWHACAVCTGCRGPCLSQRPARWCADISP